MAFTVEKNKVNQLFEPNDVMSIKFPQLLSPGLIEILEAVPQYYQPQPGDRLEISSANPRNEVPILSLYRRTATRRSDSESGGAIQELALIKEWVLSPGVIAYVFSENDRDTSSDNWPTDEVKIVVS